MFKSIISNLQSFGKTVVTRIIGFVGGIFGVKPETVEVPAPPEISDVQANNSPEVSEPKGLIKKTCTTVKKAASAAIKTAQTILKVMAQTTYVVVRYGTPIIAYSAAWNYVQAQGITAIFMGLWNMGTLPYFILCIAILLGVGAALITIETLWSALLYPVRRFLFPVKQAQQPVTVTVEPIQSEEDEEDALYIISTVEKIIKQTEDRLDERLVAIETMLNAQAIATPEVIAAPAVVTTPTSVEVVVDTRPTTPADAKPEIVPVVPVVITVENEVVDPRPTKSRQEQLMNKKISELKSMVREINKRLPASNRIGSRGEKLELVNRIILAEEVIAA